MAFDKPGLPGTDADGRPSADSGRSAFGVAGTAGDVVLALTDGWPAHRVWSDGSRADYGPEGGTGTKWVAQLYVRGQRCLYNVWSGSPRAAAGRTSPRHRHSVTAPVEAGLP